MRVGLNLLYLVPGETGGTETYARQLIPALLDAAPELRLTAFVNLEAAEGEPGPWGELIPAVTVPVRARRRAQWVRGEQQLLPPRGDDPRRQPPDRPGGPPGAAGAGDARAGGAGGPALAPHHRRRAEHADGPRAPAPRPAREDRRGAARAGRGARGGARARGGAAPPASRRPAADRAVRVG